MNYGFFISRCSSAKNAVVHHLRSLKNAATVKNFLISSCGALVLRGISVLLAPFTMKILSPAEYGLVNLASTTIYITVALIGLGLRQVFGIEYFHTTSAGRRTMVNDIMIIYLVIAVPLLCLAAYHLPLINQWLFVGQASSSFLMVLAITCFIYFFVELVYQILRYRTQALQLTILQITIGLITVACNIIFLYYCAWGPVGMLLGNLVGMMMVLFFSIYTYITNRCYAHINMRAALAKTSFYLKTGLPFIPYMLFSWVLSSGDRLVLAHYATLHDVGIYSLADTFAQLFQLMILNPMLGSYIPDVLKKFSENADNLIAVEQWNQKIMVRALIGLGLLMVLSYSVCLPLLRIIIPVKYHEVFKYILLILLGQLFLLGHYFLANLIHFKKKIYFAPIALSLCAAVNIGLNMLLIPPFGTMGCVVATLIAYIIYFAATWWYNKRLQKIICTTRL